MLHRHLNPHDGYSCAKIDDILDRSLAQDWLDLRGAVQRDPETAARVLSLCQSMPRYGTSRLWQRYVNALSGDRLSHDNDGATQYPCDVTTTSDYESLFAAASQYGKCDNDAVFVEDPTAIAGTWDESLSTNPADSGSNPRKDRRLVLGRLRIRGGRRIVP